MTDKKTEALKLALYALDPRPGMPNPEYESLVKCAIAAIREALEEQPAQQQEPVAWISEVRCVGPEYGKKRYGALPIQSLQLGYYAHTPLYTSQQPSKSLTNAQIGAIAADIWGSMLLAPRSHKAFARAIEAKLKELNK